eukprot:TRINITY_DN1200_c0_g4_i1.p1 TRINITY_DN1200_c0_g4~~TRINITY_DN1200_c0_g4_i1.p1  ORF type:complete len:704 (+),score=190.39 TRINITY_DN1200_c0_g4_i1:77-2113(+)
MPPPPGPGGPEQRGAGPAARAGGAPASGPRPGAPPRRAPRQRRRRQRLWWAAAAICCCCCAAGGAAALRRGAPQQRTGTGGEPAAALRAHRRRLLAAPEAREGSPTAAAGAEDAPSEAAPEEPPPPPAPHPPPPPPPPPSPPPANNGSSESESLYLPDAFTGSSSDTAPGAVILYLMGMFYMFFALAIVCDDYFVPALEGLIEKLQLSDDVAGATFMAAGGSAPELFTSVLGVFVAKSNVGFGTIVGSAVFNVLFVIGACSVATRGMVKGGLPLTWYPLFRDSLFYGVDLIVLTVFFHDEHIEWWEAFLLLVLYSSYVGFMSQNEFFQRLLGAAPAGDREAGTPNLKAHPDSASDDDGVKKKKKGPDSFTDLHQAPGNGPQNGAASSTPNPLASGNARGPVSPSSDQPRRQSSGKERWTGAVRRLSSVKALQRTIEHDDRTVRRRESATLVSTPPEQQLQKEADDDNEDDRWNPSWPAEGSPFEKAKFVLLFPLNWPLWATLPDCSQEVIKTLPPYFLWGFFGSIAWIAVFSYFMVWWSEIAGNTMGIPSEVMGFTILAAGTSVPDLITSVVVARKGFGDMAVSSSIGSNIFDITFGLPLPWFLWTLAHGGDSISVRSNSLGSSVLLLCAMVICTVGAIAGFGWRLNQGLGLICFGLYCVFLLITLLVEYSVIGAFGF